MAIANDLESLIIDFKQYLEQEKRKGLSRVPSSGREAKTVSLPALKPGDKAAGLEELYREFANCQNCGLGRTRNKFVFGEGDPNARLMFIGEGPGFDEDQTGRPFIGKAGQLLTKAIETTIGLKREEVYIGNIVKCHPMKDPNTPEMRGNDRPPTAEESTSCLPIITRQLEIMQPDIICLLGRSAAQTLLHSNEGIFQLRGAMHTLTFGAKDIPTIATIHPASCLYDASNKKYLWEDFKKIRDFLKKA